MTAVLDPRLGHARAARAGLIPFDRWEPQLAELSTQYRSADPFPHIRIDNFLADETARALAAEFPKPGDLSWIRYKHYNSNKLGKTNRAEFPPLIGRMVDEFNQPEFTEFMSRLTGIPHLLADPSLEGGGMHQTERGGFLNVHADFTMHHHQKQWRRRVNLILYLNDGWESSWGGELQLWDRQMKRCAVKLPPVINSIAVFNTDDTSFHGYPDPIRFPEGITRKSLALYYYTVETDASYVAKSTNYQARPGQSRRSAFLIWADKKAVHAYSKVKKALGISDDFLFKVLNRFRRKKRN